MEVQSSLQGLWRYKVATIIVIEGHYWYSSCRSGGSGLRERGIGRRRQ